MFIRRLSIFLLLFFCVFAANAQNKEDSLSLPFDFPVLLSGNFGELRTNHFHAGLDFKTQGMTGKPLHSPADGYIMRATVSPGGYGRALYVMHNNGYITVHGHLERFASAVEDVVRKYQYDNETFSVDIEFTPKEFPVKRGDVIALSGNSGYSFGPHLHMEVRCADSGELINPLIFYKQYVTDTKAPVAHSFAVSPCKGHGVVNGSFDTHTMRVKNGMVADTVSVWGVIGFSLDAEDFMDNTSNRYGVYSIELYVDDVLRFSSRVDSYSRDENRLINAWIDYERYYNSRQWFMRSYILENNPLRMLSADSNNGWVMVDEERLYNVEYRLSDYHGNKRSYRFVVKGVRENIPSLSELSGHYLYWFLNNELNYDGMRLSIPRGELFENAILDVREVESDTAVSRSYDLGGTAYPLRHKASLSLRVNNADRFLPDKYYMRLKTKKGASSVGGVLNNGWLTADITLLGCYDVAIDTLPPIVKPISEKRWGSSGKIIFSIKDAETGIAQYKGYIDGEFVLFEYGSKSGRLTCNMQREGVKRGKHKLKLYVSDAAANEMIVEKSIIY